MKGFISFLILSWFSLSNQFSNPNPSPSPDEQKQFEREMKNNPGMMKHFCEEGYPYASVGDFNVTSHTEFKDIIRNVPHLLLIISAEQCIECCKWESWFDRLNKMVFQNSTHPIISQYDFKVGRLDIFNQEWYKKEMFNMDELPNLVYYKHGELFTFPSIRDPPRMARVVERYNNYYSSLNTVEEAEEFMLKDYHWDTTGRLLTRPKSMAVIWDKEDFGEQIKNFKTIAQDFQWREDISFGVVEDKKVAFALKNKYPTWFKVGSMNHDTANTILVTRKKARYQKEFLDTFDLNDMVGDYNEIHDFIGMGSIGLVEELTHLNRNAFHAEVPKLILFYNPIEVKKTEPAVENFINNLAEKIGRRYNFLQADGRDNKRKMLSLGINGCELPCLGFESPNTSSSVFKYENELLGQSIKNVTMFLEKYQKEELNNIKQDIDLLWEGVNANEKLFENMTLTYAGVKNEVLIGQNNLIHHNPLKVDDGSNSNEISKEANQLQRNSDFMLLQFDSTKQDSFNTLKTFQYVENFLQFRLHIESIQVMAYDFGLNKLPVKFAKHPKFNNDDFIVFVKDRVESVEEQGKIGKRDIIVYEGFDQYAEDEGKSKFHALDLIHFALKESTMKYKIEKDLKIIEEDTNYGVSLIGLLEGREMQETIEMRDKEVIMSRDI